MMVLISRTIISAWQDAYSDFLPWSLLASLDQNAHHDRRAWESRIREPGSVTWIISDTRNDVGVLRIVTSVSSIPDTDSQLTQPATVFESNKQNVAAVVGENTAQGDGVFGIGHGVTGRCAERHETVGLSAYSPGIHSRDGLYAGGRRLRTIGPWRQAVGPVMEDVATSADACRQAIPRYDAAGIIEIDA
jgi:hypothetical protein